MSVRVELSPSVSNMMNLSLTAASRTTLIGTPPLGRRSKPAGFSGAAALSTRETRSPSPACLLRAKHSDKSNLCQQATLAASRQLGQISLSTGAPCPNNIIPTLDFVSSDTLAARLQSRCPQKNWFLLDCRSFIAFNLKHITGALNVRCSDRCSRRRLTSGKSSIMDMVNGTEQEKEAFRDGVKTALIVLYDESTTGLAGQDVGNNNSTLYLIASVLHMQDARVVCLKGGIEAFQNKFQHLCTECAKTNHTPLYSPTTPLIHEPAIDTATASKVLPFLYLGNERDAANKDRLDQLGVTHVLNVTSHLPFFFESTAIKYKRLPASDSGQQNLSQYFSDAISFIEQVRREHGRVLIHCQAGVSRSATITVAYIMTHTKLSMNDAFRYVRACRPIVSPNFNFMGQLYALEESLKAGSEKRQLEPPIELLDVQVETSVYSL